MAVVLLARGEDALPQVPEVLCREKVWQIGPYCGPNCLYFLLRALKIPISHQDLLRRFGRIGEKGTSLYDLKEVAQGYGVPLEALSATPGGLAGLRIPFIAHMEGIPRGADHFVLVLSVQGEAVNYLDPSSMGIARRDRGAFVRSWSGYVLAEPQPRVNWAMVVGGVSGGAALVVALLARKPFRRKTR